MPCAGPKMPEHLIRKIEGNGCLEETFKNNIKKDWRQLCDIRRDVEGFRKQLISTRAAYKSAVAFAMSYRDKRRVPCASCGQMRRSVGVDVAVQTAV